MVTWSTIRGSLIIITSICLWIDGWRRIFSDANAEVGVSMREILMILGIFALLFIVMGFDILEQRIRAGNPTTTTTTAAVFLTISLVVLTFVPFFW